MSKLQGSTDAKSVSLAGDSGVKANGANNQARESYNPSQLSRGDNNLKMAIAGSYEAGAAQEAAYDRREYHTFNFQNPTNSKELGKSSVRISGKNNDINQTWIRDDKGKPMATAGDWKLVGVGMNHVRYNEKQVKQDLATLQKNNFTGAILTPSPSKGNPPPYYYDAERHSMYGP